MPHVVVKLYPDKSEAQKTELTTAITASIMSILGNSEAAVSVGFEEVAQDDWAEQVYQPDIIAKASTIYKKPGYTV